MLIRVNPTTYLEPFTDIPNSRMILSGWDYKVRWILPGLLSVVIYKKELYRNN